MRNGYMGKILWIDLTLGQVNQEELDDLLYEQWLGGYGLGVRILYEHIPARTNPLGPENIIGFVPGLLTGTNSFFSGRFTVVTKSPLTGGWGDSNCGGRLSGAIKRAGYDGIFIKGKSNKPVYIVINNSDVEIKDAKDVWGKDTVETEQLLIDRLGKGFQIAAIGVSGENLSLISGISNDKGRFAARSGVGAVMGSKLVKAIAIKGKNKVNVASKEGIKQVTQSYLKRFKKKDIFERGPLGTILAGVGKLASSGKIASKNMSSSWRGILRKYGTAGTTAMSAISGDAPIKNWEGIGVKDFPLKKSRKISDDSVIALETKKYHCLSCPLGCGGTVTFKNSADKQESGHKPEYETLTGFGSLILNSDLNSICILNEMCNRAGLDTISAASVCAFAIECYEHNIITKQDTLGIELEWGNARGVIKLLELIIKREGIGNILADGVKKAAEKLGKNAYRFAMHAGGQELPMHDPRFDPGYAVSYTADPTPGRHTAASFIWLELMDLHKKFKEVNWIAPIQLKSSKMNFSKHIVPYSIMVKYMQVFNSCGMCLFGMTSGANIPLFDWINYATGWNYSSEQYLKIGHRIQTLRHLFNIREGISWKECKLPDRVVGKPAASAGPHKGVTLEQDSMIKQYFIAIGFDSDTGKPLEATIKSLDLSGIVQTI